MSQESETRWRANSAKRRLNRKKYQWDNKRTNDSEDENSRFYGSKYKNKNDHPKRNRYMNKDNSQPQQQPQQTKPQSEQSSEMKENDSNEFSWSKMVVQESVQVSAKTNINNWTNWNNNNKNKNDNKNNKNNKNNSNNDTSKYSKMLRPKVKNRLAFIRQETKSTRFVPEDVKLKQTEFEEMRYWDNIYNGPLEEIIYEDDQDSIPETTDYDN